MLSGLCKMDLFRVLPSGQRSTLHSTASTYGNGDVWLMWSLQVMLTQGALALHPKEAYATAAAHVHYLE